MRIAIMQPYLFPYLGYFSLIKHTDHFVFFDTPQYIRKGWINRNRILGCNETVIYFVVPIVKTARETAIKDVKISYCNDWKQKITGQLSIYKNKAPFYNQVLELVEAVLSQGYQYISELAISSVIETCRYLQIDMKYDIFSKMDLQIPKVTAPDEWALYITMAMGYQTYINPPGGKNFFHVEKYKNAGVDIGFLTQQLKKYNQRTKEFLPGLSIIDVMMFCSPREINAMMESYIEEGN